MIYNNPAVGSILGIRAESPSGYGRKQPKPEGKNPRDVAARARFELQRTAQKLLPSEKISDCMRKPVPAARCVTAWNNPDTGGAGYGNLVTCDSYSCPVCASKRAQEDRRLLSVILSQATAKGYFPVMITFTMSHKLHDKLEQVREDMAKAFDSTFSGRWYGVFKADYGMIGKVKVWETMYGLNGWHEHMHVIAIMTNDDLSDEWVEGLKDVIHPRWKKMLQHRGRTCDYEHGIHVRTAESDIAEYITKFGREPQDKTWGADTELSQMPNKKSSHGGLTPFEILAAAGGAKEEIERIRRIHHTTPEEAQRIAGELYIEYFKAHKNRPRIYISPGLKALLEVDSALDWIQVNEPDFNASQVEVVYIPVGQAWDTVRGKWNTLDLRPDLLELIRAGDRDNIHRWLTVRGIDHIMCEDIPL